MLLSVTAALAVSLLLPLAKASAAECRDVTNPYAGTRYEGVDLTQIRAKGVACPKARRVTRRAHKAGLAFPPSPSGVHRYTWNGWRVVGDLRPNSDRYRAARHGKTVHWRF